MTKLLFPLIASAWLGVTHAGIARSTRAEDAFAQYQEFVSLRGLEAVGPSPSPQPLGKSSASSAQRPDIADWSVPFLPKGSTGNVQALEIRDGEVLAGGSFIGMDDGLASSVAQWDGAGWKPLAGGLTTVMSGKASPGIIRDLDRDGEGRIYAAGWFDSAGNKACRGVARWEGSDWQCLDLYYEFDLGVTAVTVVGDQVFAANGLGVFRWNGAGWDSLAPVIRGPVTRMGNSGGKLWVAGRFTVDGDSTLRNLVVRDGSRWAGFGAGPGPVRDFSVLGEEVFAIESYDRNDRTDSQAVVRWSGSGWNGVEALPSGVGYSALGTDSSGLHLLGWDAKASILNLCRWDGRRFQLLRADAFVGSISEMKLSGGKIYMGGTFAGVGKVRADNVAAFHGGQWQSLSTTSNPGLPFAAEIMASNGSDLFLGGRYLRFAGNETVSGIAKWDGSKWDALGGGFKIPANAANFLDLNVNAIATSGNLVYAGGRFDSSQSGPALNIARWDGQAWHAMGSGFPGVVNDILPIDSGIYVGGLADSSGVSPGTSPVSGQAVAFWDGQGWRKLGAGLQGEAKKLIRFENHLYAAGKLRRAGEDSAFGILKWNGESWLTLEFGLSGLFDSAFALTRYSDRLYVLGRIRGESRSACLLAGVNAQGLVSQEEITHGISLASDNEFLYLLLQSSSQKIPALGGASVARWNASLGWQALLSDMGGIYYLYHGAIATLVPSFAVHGNHLYVSGRHTDPLNGVPVQYLFRWNRSGSIGAKKPGLRPRAAGYGPAIFFSGIPGWTPGGDGKAFDPLGRSSLDRPGRAGTKNAWNAKGVRILMPINTSSKR